MPNKSSSHSVFASLPEMAYSGKIARRVRKSNVSVIKEMMYLAAQEKAKGKEITSLGVGVPFYPAPQFIHQHIFQVLQKKPEIDKYTLLTGLPKLRKIIADLSAKLLKFPVRAEEILVTPGSMAALFYTFLALIEKGDEVILPSPYFSSYAEQISLAEGKVVPVPLKKDPRFGFRLDLPKIIQAINRKTKAIVINNPQNPTGALYLPEDLLSLAEVLSQKDVYVITDEVYDYLVYDNLPYFNLASVKKLWPKVIRCCSLSKKYGLMGWRIGYLHTEEKLLFQILKIHDANIVCAPHISQEAAIAALTGPQEVVKKHQEWLAENRTLICQRLSELSDLFSFIKPLGTYYIFPRYHLRISSLEMAKKLLFEAGVVTIPGLGFGKEGEYHLRLSFGAPKEEINRAFEKIAHWWRKKKKVLK